MFGYQGAGGEIIIESGVTFGSSRFDTDEIFGIQGSQGSQGCQGPYMYGDNGSADCPCWACKCCPPPCCDSVTVNYWCGVQGCQGGIQGCQGSQGSQGCQGVQGSQGSQGVQGSGGGWCEAYCALLQEDNASWFILEDNSGYITIQTCELPCPTLVSITISPDNPGGICCIEFIGGGATFRAVGNGKVKGIASPSSAPYPCGAFVVTLNGMPSPITVSDGDLITVGLSSEDNYCCWCDRLYATNPCGLTMRMASLRGNSRIIINRRMLTQKLYNERMKRIGRRVKSSRA